MVALVVVVVDEVDDVVEEVGSPVTLHQQEAIWQYSAPIFKAGHGGIS